MVAVEGETEAGRKGKERCFYASAREDISMSFWSGGDGTAGTFV